jgi:NADH-quinone oxidoreductase subunit G
VGALTSGSYRYKTRPWEMKHVSTVCTHCADGCKVTLGVRQSAQGAEIVRADNRDKSGMNGDFLCAKGRFGFDFVDSKERLTKPLIRNREGKLEEATWEKALRLAAGKFKEIRAGKGGSSIGVLGSSRTTNEENYLLQKFARTVLQTNNIDHQRGSDYVAFARALAGSIDKTASLRDTLTAPAILLIGGNPTEEHPLLAWNLRTNVRLNRARLYIVNDRKIKLERQARQTLQIPADGYSALPDFLENSHSEFSNAVQGEESLLAIFGPEYSGRDLQELVAWGLKRGNVRFALLGDQANARGAADLGLLPSFLPGYKAVNEPGAFAAEYDGLSLEPGETMAEMMAAAGEGVLDALLVVGADPVSSLGVDPNTLKKTFIVVQDIFLTATAALADVVLPSTSLYEKTGTVTNSFGDVQLVTKAADRAGVKSDFEILVRLAGAMGVDIKMLVPFGKNGVTADLGQSRGVQAGEADRHAVWLAANNLEPKLSPFDPLAVLDEIERLVAGYTLDRINLFGGNDVRTEPGFVPLTDLTAPILTVPEPVISAHDGLFTSAGLDRYSPALQALREHQERDTKEVAAD